MAKIITLVEDNLTIQKDVKEEIEVVLNGGDGKGEYEVRVFSTAAQFDVYSQGEEFKGSIRAQIFDLAASKSEEVAGQSKFSITEYIKRSYNETRVPIIIYSAFAHNLTELNGPGTIFRIEKSGKSVDALCNLLQQMHTTGFLEIFSPGGLLEAQHPIDLHQVFTTQFRGNELPAILTLLQECHQDSAVCATRVRDVFQRMSLRALVSKLNGEAVEAGTDSLKVNVLEHFYRRTNTEKIPIWTGDILAHKSTGKRVYIMKPRCDLAWIKPGEKAELTVLACLVKAYDFAENSKPNRAVTIKAVDAALKHNPSLGASMRIIPPSIFYPLGGAYPNGSAVDFTTPIAPLYTELEEDYEYLVTLGDDFVNEIATRFGAHIARPGITDINAYEATVGLA